MRNWLIDIQPLKLYPEYRRLWLSASLSGIGNHMTVFAAILQIFTLTNNSASVGVLGLFTGIPAILLALWGGSLGDKLDRKKLVLIATIFQSIACCALWLYSLFNGRNIFFIYCMVGFIFLLGAINIPTSAAILSRLVSSQHLQAAISLRMFSMHGAMILGPVISGLVIPKYGIPMLYFIDFISFCIALYGIIRLPAIPPIKSINTKDWATVKGGLQFVRNAPIILGALYVDFALAFFGVPNAIFPAINEIYFGGFPNQLALMVAAPSLGGLAAMLLSGRLNYLSSPGWAMIILCCLWALTVIGFAFSTSISLSLLLLFLMGALDSIVVTLRSTIIQKATRDEFRARISALEYIVGNISPQLGNVRAGLLTLIVTPKLAILIGGLSTLLITLLTFIIFPILIKLKES